MLRFSHCREFILLICMTTYANHISHNFQITIPKAPCKSWVCICSSFNMDSMSGFNIVEGKSRLGGRLVIVFSGFFICLLLAGLFFVSSNFALIRCNKKKAFIIFKNNDKHGLTFYNLCEWEKFSNEKCVCGAIFSPFWIRQLLQAKPGDCLAKDSH